MITLKNNSGTQTSLLGASVPAGGTIDVTEKQFADKQKLFKILGFDRVALDEKVVATEAEPAPIPTKQTKNNQSKKAQETEKVPDVVIPPSDEEKKDEITDNISTEDSGK